MEGILSLLLGYLVGTISPAALFGKIKNVNMKETGTKNLGASNALLVLGRSYGVIVMILDIAKAFLAAKAAKWLFPKLAVAGFVAAFGAILGHIYPFYMHFRGGKGLAALGGMVCFYDPWLLVFYLTVGVGLMILANRTVFLPVFASLTFPLIVLWQTGDFAMFAVAVAAAVVILIAHRKNYGRVKRGEEAPLRELIKTKVFKK